MMKFHHLARQSGQFNGGNNNANQQATVDFMPANSKRANLLNKQRQLLNQPTMSDDEEEEFDQVGGYLRATQMQQTVDGQHQQQELDSAGFLMDKNKKLFPQKLWELIHNPSIQHCLRWSPDGQRVYLNRNEFEAYYLKTPNNQFHTQKAISFVRQMNMYGFRKVDDCYYENDNFRRDRQHLLRNMIRRHPNKGLFAGLDQQQLAAAAAAQQAIQVNKQLQQLEHQHKQRTEQALRLNSYLNNHQFHHHQQHHSPALAVAAGLRNHHHSSPFERMSSQLLGQAMAASQLNQQSLQVQQQQQHQQQHQQHQQQQLQQQVQSSKQGAHQPIKSRLLSDFYAAAAAAAAQNPTNTTSGAQLGEQAHLLAHNQDSMHSTSSLDTQPSQCSSAIHSGSAGSPPVMPQQRRALAGAVQEASPAGQQVATDLSSQSLASRQAIHQSLVRSLLQLKQQQHHQIPQDLLASLQQQHQQQQHNSRSLLESLASLSSVGTGSIIDPASNSPTASPASQSPSPSAKYAPSGPVDMVLNLAKSPTVDSAGLDQLWKEDEEEEVEEEEEDFVADEEAATELEDEEEPIDVARKVQRFLADHRRASSNNEHAPVKRELNVIEGKRKRIKFEQEGLAAAAEEDGEEEEVNEKNRRISCSPSATSASSASSSSSPLSRASLGSLSRALVIEMCERRKDQLDDLALEEAAQYTECFLDKLLEDAALISRHSSANRLNREQNREQQGDDKLEDEDFIVGKQEQHVDDEGVEVEVGAISDDIANGAEKEPTTSRSSTHLISASSLSLALKLIPAKLLGAVQQQVSVKLPPSSTPTSNNTTHTATAEASKLVAVNK